MLRGGLFVKPVYTGDDPIQAEVVKNFLEARGIPAVVVGGALFWVRGSGATVSDDSLPRVWVIHDEDAPRALKLIEDGAPLKEETSDDDAHST